MPVNKDAKLVPNLLETEKLEQKPTRDGYGQGLVLAGEKNPNVVVLCADLTESTRSLAFQEKFPERFVELGVAEQNMASVAAGMSLAGKTPYISSYAAFSPGRNNEQIRTTIAINNANVKIAGAHAGISVGPDGATHQALEDMAIMRAMPNIRVIAPADMHEARKATFAISEFWGPAYVRFAREKTPVFTTEETPYKFGRAELFWVSAKKEVDITIIACGPLVYEALLAASALEKEGLGVEVIDSHTLKPLDKKTILASVKKSGAVVTAEEHQITGGLGGAVAEFLGENYPVPVRRVGVKDRFGESGEPAELMVKFGLKDKDIIRESKVAIQMKKSK